MAPHSMDSSLQIWLNIQSKILPQFRSDMWLEDGKHSGRINMDALSLRVFHHPLKCELRNLGNVHCILVATLDLDPLKTNAWKLLKIDPSCFNPENPSERNGLHGGGFKMWILPGCIYSYYHFIGVNTTCLAKRHDPAAGWRLLDADFSTVIWV